MEIFGMHSSIMHFRINKKNMSVYIEIFSMHSSIMHFCIK